MKHHGVGDEVLGRMFRSEGVTQALVTHQPQFGVA